VPLVISRLPRTFKGSVGCGSIANAPSRQRQHVGLALGGSPRGVEADLRDASRAYVLVPGRPRSGHNVALKAGRHPVDLQRGANA